MSEHLSTVPKRILGKTNIPVSVLGLGTVKFGRNQGVKYPQHFELPTESEIKHLLTTAQSYGINVLDTAPAYGNSEERLGLALKDQRDQWVIVGKAGETFIDGHSSYHFEPQAIYASVEASLKRLQTDYLDVLLIHSDGNDMAIIERYDIFNTLDQLKAQGKIRAGGISTKTIEGGIACVDNADVVMCMYNPIACAEIEVINHAKTLDKGVLIKKALASGHINKIDALSPIDTAMQFIFKESAVSSVIVGTINLKHLHENVTSAIKAANHSKYE